MGKRASLALALAVALALPLIFWRYLSLPVCFGVVVGTSMYPTLSPGDIVVGIRGEPRVGDIVVYDSPGGLIIHRVISINGTVIVTKGDGCRQSDDPVSLDRVFCVVLYVVRGTYVAALAVAAATILCLSAVTRTRKS